MKRLTRDALIACLLAAAHDLEQGRQVWITSTALRDAANMLAADAPEQEPKARELYQYQYLGTPGRTQLFEYLDEDRWVLCRTLGEKQEIDKLIANGASYKLRVLRVFDPGSSEVEPHASESVAGSTPASDHPELQQISEFGELQNELPKAREMSDADIDTIAGAQDDEGWFVSRLTAIEWRWFARAVLAARSES